MNAVIALKVIKALDERFATDYVVNIIIGKLTPQIQMFRHDGLDVFASGNDKDRSFLEFTDPANVAGRTY